MSNITEMLGKTYYKVTASEDYLEFKGEDNVVCFYHSQECCESVWIEEIFGDLSDLQDTPILDAREDANGEEEGDYYYDVTQWTFYTFRTIKGTVTVRWCGTSNGYYSTSVSYDVDPGRKKND
jgi:hypothetical protein